MPPPAFRKWPSFILLLVDTGDGIDFTDPGEAEADLVVLSPWTSLTEADLEAEICPTELFTATSDGPLACLFPTSGRRDDLPAQETAWFEPDFTSLQYHLILLKFYPYSSSK